ECWTKVWRKIRVREHCGIPGSIAEVINDREGWDHENMAASGKSAKVRTCGLTTEHVCQTVGALQNGFPGLRLGRNVDNGYLASLVSGLDNCSHCLCRQSRQCLVAAQEIREVVVDDLDEIRALRDSCVHKSLRLFWTRDRRNRCLRRVHFQWMAARRGGA